MEEHPIIKGMTAFVVVFKWLQGLACIWFLRLCSLPALGWGLWDAWRYQQGDQSTERADDAAIRITIGVILILCWVFLARRRGPLTINRNGILERWPLSKKPVTAAAPEPAQNAYASPAADKYR